MSLKITITPYPNPDHLPKGYKVWMWEVRASVDNLRVAWGSVQRIEEGYHVSHAATVIPQFQNRGVYSRFVLPNLANAFGSICSAHDHSAATAGAWKKSGAFYDVTEKHFILLRKEA